MLLDQVLNDGRLKRQPPSPSEVARLLSVADRDFADANVPGLSADRRFAIAYGGALLLASVVLRASGYRAASDSGGHHWLTIALLPELMGDSQAERSSYLDRCRRLRNKADYDGIDIVRSADALELLGDGLKFRNDVLRWLDQQHPELRPRQSV
jgi:hypothetical protein